MKLHDFHELVRSPAFAGLDFWIVATSGGLLCLFPKYWYWFLFVASIPLAIRFISGFAPIHRTKFDWLVLIFVLSGVAGYWAAYDPSTASAKFILILAAGLLYYAIGSQPEVNRSRVAAAFFCLGLGVSFYFLLTHDFIEAPRRLEIVNTVGRWLMKVRPSIGWEPIHQNYVAGLAAITAPFGYHLLRSIGRASNSNLPFLLIASGLVVLISAIIMTTSRGAILAVVGAIGVSVLSRIFRLGRSALFPSVVLLYLAVIVLLLYLGPSAIGGSVGDAGRYGSSTRAQVFTRSAQLIGDFPFTGGGLGSFPGLYSQYLLVIPHYFLPNAHNMFLDVFIEQGIAGGGAFLTLYLAAIWLAARAVVVGESPEAASFSWIVLLILVMAFVHGLVDDYLYNGKGTILSLAPVGVAALLKPDRVEVDRAPRSMGRSIGSFLGVAIAAVMLIQLKTIRSAWFANLGAVQMARIELAGFPTGKWAEPNMVSIVKTAEPALLSSLEADPYNRTANHRLGLLSMLEQDFPAAVAYLGTAHSQAPGHRGIIKVLGYSFVWLGREAEAEALLTNIPEAAHELDVYVWWWQVHQRDDLSGKASSMSSLLKGQAAQP